MTVRNELLGVATAWTTFAPHERQVLAPFPSESYRMVFASRSTTLVSSCSEGDHEAKTKYARIRGCSFLDRATLSQALTVHGKPERTWAYYPVVGNRAGIRS
jgi:hypothetical protein